MIVELWWKFYCLRKEKQALGYKACFKPDTDKFLYK